MAGAGGLGRWFVDVGLPGTQRNAFGQLNGGAVGKGILFSMINQVLPGFGNYLGHRSDVANHAWDSMGGFLNNGEGKIDPSSLMDYGTNLGGFQIDRNFPGVNMGGTPSVGNTPPAGQPPLDSGLTYQAPDFQIDRTIAPVKVDGSAGGGRFGNYNAFGDRKRHV